MGVTLLIGNGFNYLIENIIRQYDPDRVPEDIKEELDTLAEDIHNITGLWKRFDQLFAELKEQTPQLNDEELIRLIYSVLNFFSSIEGFKKIIPPEDIQNIKNAFDRFLLDQIAEIAEEFRAHQASAGYKSLKKLFPEFGSEIQACIEEAGIGELNIITTNYDGVIDTLLTKRETRGFFSTDGFGNSDFPELLNLDYSNFDKSNIRCIHLHGSYRFKRYLGTTYKTKANVENKDPVIVFNQPEMKEEIIRNDNVLSEYWYFFRNSLRTNDKLIILGNSMRTEPHIKQLIRDYFNRDECTLVSCSRNPQHVTEEVKEVYSGQIYEESTDDISDPATLIEYFHHILTT